MMTYVPHSYLYSKYYSLIYYSPKHFFTNSCHHQTQQDRCHRIGQTKPVTVYKLFAKESVDEDIFEMGERKSKLSKAVLQDDRAAAGGGAAGAGTPAGMHTDRALLCCLCLIFAIRRTTQKIRHTVCNPLFSYYQYPRLYSFHILFSQTARRARAVARTKNTQAKVQKALPLVNRTLRPAVLL